MSLSVRERIEQLENESLSKYAARCLDSRGRARQEEECSVRTIYQRDCDRIVHSSAFRRLKDKTQVFLSPENVHYRTRLTHTLEVAHTARTISRALRLNEDLTEAIALGHDLGHTPFGHAGERALNSVFPGGFTHYRQSLRVVDRLEKNGEGLNLTYEVRNGILCHTTGDSADTLEGRVVRLADRIAYVNHDIDDAIRARVMTVEDIPADIRRLLGDTKSQRINTLAISVIENSLDDIRIDHKIGAAFNELHAFMFEKVYTNPVCKSEESKAISLVKQLYFYFSEHPDDMPPIYREIARSESPARAACDYISGMTDIYAKRVYTTLYIPRSWEE